MIKNYVATGFTCLAIGSITGYLIADMTRQPSVQASTMIATGPIASKALTRNELEQRLIACIGKPLRLQVFTDKDLNDSLFECERLKAQS
jgi:hypothetical protein